ncbi:MAG: LPS export ABC transporter periplasmic protein LptC [Bdellovibrionales bacterium]|nr:LPS export ABC transporter periplasmic protein LptC [Bdellovibrionales bacterium]
MGLLIILQIVAFSPRKLEEEVAPEAIDAGTLRPQYTDSFVQATIPADRIPEYTVEGFQQVSTQAGNKQWLMQADRAFYYTTDGIVHARDVHADLYDAEGKITVITSKEAKYFIETRDLELFGDVKTIYPTGLETTSPYMLYQAANKTVSVPVAYPVEGKSVPPAGGKIDPTAERFDFHAKGLKYSGSEDRVELLSDVQVRVIHPDPKKGEEITTVDSDRATIDRKRDLARFTMLESRPAELRFVKINQPGMSSKSRRAEVRINANPRKLRTVRALDDVKIEERPKVDENASIAERRRARNAKPRYATAGIAEFDSFKNLIVLRDYPQVYQDRDTITGETIIVHRDSDLVEVDQSNAFSEGELEEGQ